MVERRELHFFSITAWLFQRLVYYFCRWYFFRVKDWTVTASPGLNQLQKPVILAVAPHLSHSDVVIVPSSLPIQLLPVRWLADTKVFSGRVRSLWLKLWGAIPVDRDRFGSIEPEEIRRIVEFADKGKCIGVFPECCLVGGHFGDPHRDLLVTAMEKKISVLPVNLTGNDDPTNFYVLNTAQKKVRVTIGDPLSDPANLLDELTS